MTSKFEYTSAGIRRPDQARGDLYDRIQFHTGLFFLFLCYVYYDNENMLLSHGKH